MNSPIGPFAPGSISLGLHAHPGRAGAIVRTALDEAARAAAAGFDGVTFSEHHGGFPGYLPNPTLMAGMVLDAVPDVWAGPSPTILTLRPTAAVIEDLAWTAARHPGRVGAGFAAGYQDRDFEILGASFADRSTRFWDALYDVAASLAGSATGALAEDLAIASLIDDPIPVVAGIGGPLGARRAAERNAGILVTSLLDVADARALVDTYRGAGGTGPVVLIRRAWVGESAPTLDQQLDHYRDAGHRPPWMEEPMEDAIYTGEPAAVARRLGEDLVATGADALNVRIHTTGVPPDAIADQLGRFGDVVRLLRDGRW